MLLFMLLLLLPMEVVVAVVDCSVAILDKADSSAKTLATVDAAWEEAVAVVVAVKMRGDVPDDAIPTEKAATNGPYCGTRRTSKNTDCQ